MVGLTDHPFDKAAAVEFINESPLDNWLKEACKARIEAEDMPNHPRILMLSIGEYLEMSLKFAKAHDDVKRLCELCRFGMLMRLKLFNRDEMIVCGEECPHYSAGFGVYDPE